MRLNLQFELFLDNESIKRSERHKPCDALSECESFWIGLAWGIIKGELDFKQYAVSSTQVLSQICNLQFNKSSACLTGVMRWWDREEFADSLQTFANVHSLQAIWRKLQDLQRIGSWKRPIDNASVPFMVLWSPIASGVRQAMLLHRVTLGGHSWDILNPASASVWAAWLRCECVSYIPIQMSLMCWKYHEEIR